MTTKRLLAAQQKGWLDSAVIEALEANAFSRDTAYIREEITAFLEKRKHIWERDLVLNRCAAEAHECPSAPLNFLARNTFGEFNNFKSRSHDIKYAQVGDYAVDDAGSSERQRAIPQKLGAAVRRSVLHQDDNTPNAGDDVHGAPHPFHTLARNHPVG